MPPLWEEQFLLKFAAKICRHILPFKRMLPLTNVMQHRHLRCDAAWWSLNSHRANRFRAGWSETFPLPPTTLSPAYTRSNASSPLSNNPESSFQSHCIPMTCKTTHSSNLSTGPINYGCHFSLCMHKNDKHYISAAITLWVLRLLQRLWASSYGLSINAVY